MTGSHNPPGDNGLKIVLQCQVLTAEQIVSIFTRIQTKNFQHGNGSSHNLDIISMYYTHVVNDIKLNRKLRVVIDCGNGIVGKIMPDLLRKFRMRSG